MKEVYFDEQCSVAKSCPTLCRGHGFPVLHCPRVCSNIPIVWVMPSNHLILGCLFSFPQFFSESRSFPVSCLFTSSGQSIGASTSVLPRNIQGWFPLGMTGLSSLQSKGLSRFLHHHNWKASIIQCLAFFMVQLSHLHLTTGKTILLTIRTFVSKVMSLLFNTLSRFLIAFLPRSQHFLIKLRPVFDP